MNTRSSRAQGRRLAEECTRTFKSAQDLKVPRIRFEDYKRGRIMTAAFLTKCALAGLDVHYILTGTRSIGTHPGYAVMPRDLAEFCVQELAVLTQAQRQLQAALNSGPEPDTEGVRQVGAHIEEIIAARQKLERWLWPHRSMKAGAK